MNLRNAKANPNAQTRDWELSSDSFGTDDRVNPHVAGRLRRNDCCQITDGGAGVVLVSDRWLADNGRDRAVARIAGWGHTTVGLPLAPKLARSADEPYVMPHVRRAITDAFDRADVSGVDDLDAIETHDCMTPSEYMAIDHFGITDPGESWKAIEDGDLERDGRIPVNPSGMNADRSECLILDAARPGAEPVARIALPERISSGTHACWAPADALRRSPPGARTSTPRSRPV